MIQLVPKVKYILVAVTFFILITVPGELRKVLVNLTSMSNTLLDS